MKNKSGYFGVQQATSILASSILSLCGGITLGYSAVLTSQLIEDDSFSFDEKYSSWIASITPISMFIGCICCGSLIDAYGRRTGFIVIAFPYIAGWITLAFANNIPILLFGRFLTGICTGAVRPITMIYIGETSDPKYRASALFCPSLAMSMGVLLSHVIFTFLYWRVGSLICGIPNVISLVMFLFLPESPLWLINRDTIDDGIKNFIKFRGNGNGAKEELALILNKQREKPVKPNLKQVFKILNSKSFFKPYLVTFVLFLEVQFSGVNVLPFYTNDFVEHTFSTNVNHFLLIMIIDSILIAGSVFICFVGKNLPRKKTFVTCSFGTAISLFLLVILLHTGVRLIWASVALMVFYIALSIITVCIAWSLVGEIFPTSIRGLGSGISSGTSHFLLFISVKVTPIILSSYNIKVLYTFYGTIALICSVTLCFILPETNGKSLHEIEERCDNNKAESITSL